MDEMLAQRIPIHLGGMSDPFPPMERQLGVTLRHLEIARDHKYPVIASTKSCLVLREEYLKVLSEGNFAVQVSIPTIDDKLGFKLDAGAPLPSERLKMIESLSKSGIPVSCRIQPVLPGREFEVLELIDAAASAGAKQVGIEHLKLPIEGKWPHRDSLNAYLGMDLKEHFTKLGAIRVGREWVLPITARLGAIRNYRSYAKTKNIYFGAADNDLLHLSDGQVCCSGADLLGLGKGFGYNFLSAVRNHSQKGEIRASSLKGQWRPDGSIAQYINSHSRRLGNTIEQYLMANWNGRPNGVSPETFFGVKKTGRSDHNGLAIYKISQEAISLMSGMGGGKSDV